MRCEQAVGFVAMAEKESPKIAFETMYTRWPEPPECTIPYAIYASLLILQKYARCLCSVVAHVLMLL